MALGSGPAAANECLVHNKLIKNILFTDNFLKDLATGDHPEAAEMLDKLLTQTSIIPLRGEMGKARLGRFEQMAVQVIADQRALLDTQFKAGRETAKKLAVQLDAHQNLNEFRKRIFAVTCNTNGTAGSAESHGAQVTTRTVSTIVTFFALPLLATLSLFYLIEKQNKNRRKLGKRYPCNLACTYTLSNRSRQAVIVDIGCLGAKLKTDANCNQGDIMNIKVANLNINAQVQWQNSCYTGVQFAKTVPNSILQKMIMRGKEQNGPAKVPQPA